MSFEDSYTKLKAARYFYGQIENLYSPGMPVARFSDNTFFACDALIWELYAAFDLCLLTINRELNLGFAQYDVGWKHNFQRILEGRNTRLFNLIRDTQGQLWFKHLKQARKYITHRQIYLVIDYSDKTLNVASVGTPGILAMDGSIDVLDQTKRWITGMDSLIGKVMTLAQT